MCALSTSASDPRSERPGHFMEAEPAMKTLLGVYAAVAAVICVNFAAVPAFWIRLYGATPDPQSVFLYRLLAATFGGIAAIVWLGRSVSDGRSRDALTQGAI